MMKLRLIFILLLNFSSSALMAQSAPGIHFRDGSWDDLIAMAEKEKLPIFVDVYTDWCVPCKLMDATVFKDKTVGIKYNTAFISYKLNAEKGEGPALAKKFNIKAYPTFLFLNSNGFLLEKVVGERETAPFLAVADYALVKLTDKNQLGNLEAEFKNGNRTPSFLKRFITAKTVVDMDNGDLFTELMNAYPVDSLQTEENLSFIGSHLNSLHTPALQFLMRRYQTLRPAVKTRLQPHLYKILVNQGMTATLEPSRLVEFEQLAVYARQLEPLTEDQYLYLNRISMVYGKLTKNPDVVKETGYKAIGNIMDIPVAEIKSEDINRYKQIMAPFLSGEKDSTKIPDFQEERKVVVNTYSRELVSKLLSVASAFNQTLPVGDPARKDARKWAERANMLIPGIKEALSLIQNLEN